MNIVFVYGTLRRQHYNHSYLEHSEFIAEFVTPAEFSMINLGLFPAVIEGGSTAIHGELYKVDDDTLSALDVLEGVPSFYSRIHLDTDYGQAFMYVLKNNDKDYPVIESGIWE